MYDKNWADVDANALPDIKTELPGPKSAKMHNRAAKYMKGYSSQVRLFPVVFESGKGCTLTDVDGNTFIDFSSGIYVTGLGHCHPKISEAVAKYTKQLMNCHDFTTEIKMKLLEKLASITMGDLNGIQLYDSGTTAVEAGLRCARAVTGNFEFISFWRDFHGKTMGSASCAIVDQTQGMRAPGYFLAPRPNCYRCPFKMKHPECTGGSFPSSKFSIGWIMSHVLHLITELFNLIFPIQNTKFNLHVLSIGHKNVAYIGGPEHSKISIQKLSGFKKALESDNTRINEKNILQLTNYSLSQSYLSAQKLIMSKSPPSAIVCANDTLSIGCLKLLVHQNINVPQEIAAH